MGDRLASRVTEELQRQNLRTQLFASVTIKIHKSLQLEKLLYTTVIEVQKILQADRVLVYRLWSDGTGRVVTEAVVQYLPTVLKWGAKFIATLPMKQSRGENTE